MSKRDIVIEIQEKNARAKEEYLHGNLELYSLEASFSRLTESDETLLALHVMGTASCIEVSVREAIKRLIDSGDPFFERAEAFKEHIRFDYFLTKALSTGQITFGDLISHSLPVSRIEHITNHFEILFNNKGDSKNFKKFHELFSTIRKYVEPSDDELFGNEKPGNTQQTAPILVTNAEEIVADVSKIFQKRHLVAHEANFKVVQFSEISELLRSARIFVEALYELVEQILNPGASRNGIGGSIQELMKAGEIREEAQEILERILTKIPKVPSDQKNLLSIFKETNQIFDAYHTAETDFRLALHGMLTSNAMRNIEANVTKKLWQHRKNYLQEVEEHVDFYARPSSS